LPKVVVLGYGGWVSDPAFGQSGLVVVSDGGTTILLDAGEGTWYWLGECGLPRLPDAAIVSHGHGDHVLGVPTLVMWASYTGEKLRLWGHPSAIKAVKGLLKATWVREKFGSVVDAHPIVPGEWVRVAKDVEVLAIEALHPVPAYSFVLAVDDSIIAYSGDTRPNPAFIEAARGADLLIHEVGVPAGQEVMAERFGHTSESEICRVVEEVSPKLFMPYHYFVSEPKIVCEDIASVVRPRRCLRVDLG